MNNAEIKKFKARIPLEVRTVTSTSNAHHLTLKGVVRFDSFDKVRVNRYHPSYKLWVSKDRSVLYFCDFVKTIHTL